MFSVLVLLCFFVRSGVRDWIVKGFNDKRKTKHQKETRKKKKKKKHDIQSGEEWICAIGLQMRSAIFLLFCCGRSAREGKKK